MSATETVSFKDYDLTWVKSHLCCEFVSGTRS